MHHRLLKGFKTHLPMGCQYIFLGLLMLKTSWGLDVLLPKPTGPFGVGVVNFELFDPAREQLRGHDKKQWMVSLYYPAEKTQKTDNYMPGTIQEGDVRGARVHCSGIVHAQILKGQQFPVIIAMPGRGNLRQQYTILYEALTSSGYIIIAMDQPYVANFVKFPDGRKITLTLKDAWKLPRDRDYRYQYDDLVIASAIKDIDFVLDHLQDFGHLSKAFDISQVILLGHSLGGNIAHIKGFSDKRIKFVIDIDSKITERAIFGRIGVPQNPDAKPVLFIRGMLQYQEDVGDQLTKISNSTIWAPKVQHSAFSDDAYLVDRIPNYQMSFWESFFNWFLEKRPYCSGVDTDVGQYKLDEWFEQYPLYIIKWLHQHLHEASH